MQAGCWMPILQRVLRWRTSCAISGLSSKLITSSPVWPLLLDKVYWTFAITLNFEKWSWIPNPVWKLIHTPSFKSRPNKHFDLVNPTVADLRDVCHRAWASLHDIDHDIWPWRCPWIMSPISEIDSDNIIWTNPNNQRLDFFKSKSCWTLRNV